MKDENPKNLIVLCAVLTIAVVKTFFLLKFQGFNLFNADQAVLGLMAKHILEGHPMVYYYGQGYMGSLEAFTAALLFKFGGMTPLMVQIAPFLFFLAFLAINYFLILKVFDFITAVTVSLLLALSPPALSALSVTALGGYPETLFFGTLTLWLLICWRERKNPWTGFAAGLTAGIGFWVNNLIIFYFFAAAVFIFLNSGFRAFFREFKNFRHVEIPIWLRIVLFAVNLFIAFYFIHEFASFLTSGNPLQIGGFKIPLSNLPFHVKKLKNIILLAGAEWLVLYFYYAWPERFKNRLKQIFPLMIGFAIGTTPAWTYYLLGGEGYRMIHGSCLVYLKDLLPKFSELVNEGLAGTILGIPRQPILRISGFFFCFAALAFYFSRFGKRLLHPKNDAEPYAFFPFYLTAAGFFICLFNNLVSMRYLLPLFSAVPLMMALGLRAVYSRSRTLFSVFTAGILAVYLAGNILLIRTPPAKPQAEQDYQNLIAYLDEKEIRGAYANYWISYMLTFLTREKIIGSPYQSHDRYPAYTKQVKTLKRVAYIFSSSSQEESLFGGRIESQKQIGEFKVFIVDYSSN